jgi:hypothetical protein
VTDDRFYNTPKDEIMSEPMDDYIDSPPRGGDQDEMMDEVIYTKDQLNVLKQKGKRKFVMDSLPPKKNSIIPYRTEKLKTGNYLKLFHPNNCLNANSPLNINSTSSSNPNSPLNINSTSSSNPSSPLNRNQTLIH